MPSRSILVYLAAVTLNMTGVGLVWPILPRLVESIGGGNVSQVALMYGAIAVAFSLAQFVFSPILGALSDRFGRRPVMLVAMAGLGLDNILLAFAPSLPWLFAGRILGGAFGATMSVTNAAMADVTDPKDRAGAFGMVGAAFGVGFILGPLLGGVLGEIDLRLPFLVAAALSFVNVAAGWFLLEETLPAGKRAAPAAQQNALAALRFIASSRVLLLLAATLLLSNTVQRGLESIWVLFTGVRYGWGAWEAGLSLALVGACFVFVQGFLVRKVVARFGERRTVLFGFLLSATMYVLLAINPYGWLTYFGIAMHILGWGCAGPAIQSIASRQVGPEAQGLLQGGITAVMGLAAIFGPAAATATFAWSTQPAIALPGLYFLVAALAFVAAALVGFRAGRNTESSAMPPSAANG